MPRNRFGRPNSNPKQAVLTGGGGGNAPCELASHHLTNNNSVTIEGDRVFLKQPVKHLTLANMQHMVPRDLPTTKLCAAPAAATGVHGGSQMCDQHRKMQTDENCATTNSATATGDQCGRKLLAERQDVRHMAPDDATCSNATTDAESLRRMANSDTRWVTGELPQSAVFPINPGTNPYMGHLGHRFSSPKITLPMGIMPAIKNRILQSFPDSVAKMPSYERAAQKLYESPAFLSETGSREEGQLEFPTIAMIRNDPQLWGRTGKTKPQVSLGAVVARIDYASQ